MDTQRPDPRDEEPGCLRSCVQSLALFLVLVGVGLAAVEHWVDRYAWPIADAWYRIEATDDDIRFGCQHFAPVRFSRQPAAGRTRILVLGGSTTFGYPERPAGDTELTRARHGVVGVMQAALDARWPGRFELINLGINGGNSADTRLMMRRAADWGAEGLVVYDGHNEFMSVPSHFRPSTWRFALVRRLSALKPKATAAPGWVGPAAYGGPAHAEAVVAQMTRNLDEVLGRAAAGGLPTVVSSQAANLAGFDPNWSTADAEPGLGQLDLPALEARWSRSPDSADVAFALGHARRAAEQDDLSPLQAAADLDGLPFRATTAVNHALGALTQAHGAVWVDGVGAVRAGGPAPGNELFYDWVHPRPVAQVPLASALLEGMAKAGMLPGDAPPARLPTLDPGEALEAELRTARSWLQWAAVRHHDPSRRLERARHYARRYLDHRPDDPEALGVMAIAAVLDGTATGPLPTDPEVRRRLGSLHPRIQAILAE